MSRAIIVVIMLQAMLVCIAEVSLMPSMFLPTQATALEFIEVEDIAEGVCQKGVFWDFSSAPIIDGNVNRMYMHPMDSLYIEVLDGSMHKYQLSGDTVYWKGFENPGTDMSDSIPTVVMRFPFSYGDSLSSNYILKGKYYKQLQFIEDGDIKVIADATGMVKMPNGDTINNILRLKEIKHFHASMSPHSIVVPLDTISDTIPLQIQTRYRWYAQNHPLPIAEIIEKKVFKKHQLVAIDRKCLIVDIDSKTLQTIRSSRQRSIDTKSLIGKTPSIQDEQINTPTNIQSLTTTEIGRRVTLQFNIVNQSTMLSIDVVDFTGRVYFHSEPQTYPKGAYQRELSLSEIPIGDYMIVIVENGNKETPIKQIVRKR